jgi:fibronectin type 3 domain-containing protein
MATAPAPHSVNLSWNAVSMAGSYNVYRKRKIEKAYTQIASGVTTATYTDTTVVDGHTYDYAVTAVCGTGQTCGAGQESGYSNISVAVIP